jgi:hypothetical protein
MDYISHAESIISSDHLRWRLLEIVRLLALPDCWIGAGFVRDAVWDKLHGRGTSPLRGDVDVVWFDPERIEPSEDRRIELALKATEPSIQWSVKNQARMHLRNGDEPYFSVADAIRFWPETATAVVARRSDSAVCEIVSPFGLDDLFGMILQPTPHFSGERHDIYRGRVQSKRWLKEWPLLREAKEPAK